MADSFVTANEGAGGANFAVDQDGGGKVWPYAKLAWGAGGTQSEASQAAPVPVQAAPWFGTPLGYQQLTLAGAASLTVPSGATFGTILIEGAPVRWRDDGTAPTATVGMPLGVGAAMVYSADLAALQVIGQATGAIVNISYYK